MSIEGVPAVSQRAIAPNPTQSVAPAVGDATAGGGSAGEGAVSATSGAATSASSSVTSSSSVSQSFQSTSVSSRVEGFMGGSQSNGSQELMQLLIALVLMNELLNGEQSSDSMLNTLAMAVGLGSGGGGGESSSYFAMSSSYESVSISQQSSVTQSSANAAYGQHGGAITPTQGPTGPIGEGVDVSG